MMSHASKFSNFNTWANRALYFPIKERNIWLVEYEIPGSLRLPISVASIILVAHIIDTNKIDLKE
jgi:hypothetical protein